MVTEAILLRVVARGRAMRIIGLLLLVLGVMTLAALLLGDAPPFISDYVTRDQLKIVAPGLLFLGAFVVLMTGEG